MQACGLKLFVLCTVRRMCESRLMQACGLKQILRKKEDGSWEVTPHAGVWIETFIFLKCIKPFVCHASCRRVD